MKRKMVYIGVSYFSGLFFASFLYRSYDFLLLCSLITAGLFLKYIVRFQAKELIVCGISFVLAFSYYRLYESFVYDKILAYAGKEVVFSGRITQTEITGGNGKYYIKGRLGTQNGVELLFYGNDLAVYEGDTVTISGVLKEIDEKSAQYYKCKGIYLCFGKINSLESKRADASFTETLYEYKMGGYNRIQQTLTKKESAILTAIVFGDKSELSNSDKAAFYRAGIGHVMSVSGLHIVILSGILLLLLKKIRLSGKLIFLITEAVIILFAISIGMPISVLRAIIMVTIAGSAVFFNRKADILNSLCIAVLILTLPNPFVIRNASFLLSVTGTFGIGVFGNYMTIELRAENRRQRLLKNFLTYFYVMLLIIPVSMLYFPETSVISPVTNIIIMPFCTVALVCGFIVAITGGAALVSALPLKIAEFSCRAILNISIFTGKIKYSFISFGQGYLKLSIISALVIIIIVYAVSKSRKVLSYTVCVLLLLMTGENILYKNMNKDILKIAVIGEDGNTVIVVTQNQHTDIIDIAGGRTGVGNVDNYLKQKGITQINTLCIIDAPYQVMAAYEDYFYLSSVENVVMGESAAIWGVRTLCGLTPVYCPFDKFEIAYEKYSITVSDAGIIEVGYNDFKFKCFTGVSETNVDAGVIYGKYIPQDVYCGFLIILDEIQSEEVKDNVYIGEGDYEILIDKEGKISVNGF